MRRIETDTMIIEAFDLNVYTQERNLVKVTDKQGRSMANIDLEAYPSTGGRLVHKAAFLTDSNGVLTIDASEILRLMDGGRLLVMNNEDSVELAWSKVGLISPEHMKAPEPVGVPFVYDGAVPVVALPRMILQTIGEYLMFEISNPQLWPTLNNISAVEQGGFEYPVEDSEYEQISFEADEGSVIVALRQRDGDDVINMPLTERICGREYITLRWRGRLGKICQTVWEVRNRNYATSDSVDLATIDNSFDTRKGQLWSMTARLEGLTDYDYWYYSSIVTSSEVAIAENMTEGGELQPVQVVTKDVTIPNGNDGKLHTLEIKINYRRYDTF